MPQETKPSRAGTAKAVSAAPRTLIWIGRLVVAVAGLAAAGVAAVMMAVGIALAVAYPNLPDVAGLADYRPKLPLRVLAADGQLMGEYGEERRNLLTIDQIPDVMKNAVLAIEDARFFQHSGVDYRGMVRAALANLREAKSQGASTITMQVARNVYLSAEKSYTRKIYEVLLTFKLEHMLTKEQILEIYMNQIFLGRRAYGFSSASQIYYGKPLKDVTIAEAAMLAGLPQAPSAFNPVRNPKRARTRQLYIIDRMVENGFITPQQAEVAKAEEIKLHRGALDDNLHGDFAAEMVRQAIVAQYGEAAYTRGLVVSTTIDPRAQEAAYRAVRQGVLDFERRQFYRGPELFIDLPEDAQQRDTAIDEALAERPDNGDLLSAVVLQVQPKKVVVVRQDDTPIEITGEGLRPVQSALSEKAGPNIKLRPGAVVRIVKVGDTGWRITQLPEVESAFIAMDPRNGRIAAMIGGFDFNKNKFNHATQAWRQPGSSFKPFIYSAALEKGLTPMTVVNDAPLFYSASQTGGKPWEPKNYDGTFEGPMSVRRALARSKNMVSIRVLQMVGTQGAQNWVTRFGFDADKHPPYLTMALGAGSVTPLQMVAAYSVFANGGHRVPPLLITRVADARGRVLYEAPQTTLDNTPQAIEPRNAFIMNSLLQEIARTGTAARAQATLKRPDLYGKTGTTNDAVDAWFVGFQPTLAAAAWVGYDTPRNLGSRETGGGLALPIWISFMQEMLKGVPVSTYPVPPGVVNIGGEWYYEEFGPGNGVHGLGLADPWPGAPSGTEVDPNGVPTPAPLPPVENRRSILDLFRN